MTLLDYFTPSLWWLLLAAWSQSQRSATRRSLGSDKMLINSLFLHGLWKKVTKLGRAGQPWPFGREGPEDQCLMVVIQCLMIVIMTLVCHLVQRSVQKGGRLVKKRTKNFQKGRGLPQKGQTMRNFGEFLPKKVMPTVSDANKWIRFMNDDLKMTQLMLWHYHVPQPLLSSTSLQLLSPQDPNGAI